MLHVALGAVGWPMAASMKRYEFHPFANVFPMMTDSEYAELVADIKANGLEEAITMYDGKVLDGRNRYKACLELGHDPEYGATGLRDGDLQDDAEALAYVISKNLMRRHLDESQRAMVAAKLSGLKPGQRADQVQAVPIGTAAAKLNVGVRSVKRARKVIDKGTPGLVAAVERGDKAVSSAVAEIEGTKPDATKRKPDSITALKEKLVESNRQRKHSTEINRALTKENVNLMLERDYLREQDEKHRAALKHQTSANRMPVSEINNTKPDEAVQSQRKLSSKGLFATLEDLCITSNTIDELGVTPQQFVEAVNRHGDGDDEMKLRLLHLGEFVTTVANTLESAADRAVANSKNGKLH
jgi:hypothetical protein